ncbi:MAG: hypothetical protein KIT84_24400 [Labilithrix sp.]|nr:hypothetical protein [Labilithrix sp.]MCW5814190.1 hypothetical protein [Labilithrix sp.]
MNTSTSIPSQVRVAVGFSEPPRPHGPALGLEGEGAVWAEHDAVVLQGGAPAGKALALAPIAAWLIALAVCGAFVARGGELEHPPAWLVVVCIALSAAGLAVKLAGARLRRPTTLRLGWSEVLGAAPLGLSMRLFTTRGEIILAGLGPSGAANLQRLGERITRR